MSNVRLPSEIRVVKNNVGIRNATGMGLASKSRRDLNKNEVPASVMIPKKEKKTTVIATILMRSVVVITKPLGKGH